MENWLKSLRPRLSDEEIKKIRSEEYTKGFNDAAFGSKQGWSEEDENYLEEIIDDLKFCKKNRRSCRNGLIEGCVDWLNNRLKSLRPQPHWKPSEEQMGFLKRAVDGYDITCRGQVALESLYNDLKKL
jgi:hypothetical protein